MEDFILFLILGIKWMPSAQSNFGKELPCSFGFQQVVILFQELKEDDRKHVMRKIFRPILAVEFTLVL